MANSVDPDQMPHSVAADLGLHCFQRSICPNTEGLYGIQGKTHIITGHLNAKQ